jgi:hypothetical protein
MTGELPRVLALIFVLVSGIAGPQPAAAGDAADMEAVYRDYRTAVATKDWEKVRPYLNEARAQAIENDSPDTPAKFIAAHDFWSPPLDTIEFVGAEVSDGTGTLKARAQSETGDSEGVLGFVREAGGWRVQTETWNETLK